MNPAGFLAAGLGRVIAAAEPVGRDAARDAAHRELSKRLYHGDDPSLVERLLTAIGNWLDRRLGDAARVAPGGVVGLVALLLVLAAVVALVWWRAGPPRRTARAPRSAIELSGPLPADEHRRRADSYAAEGRYAEAVRERMRAVVGELEARGVIEPRPSRTADEVARDGGRLVPTVAADLSAAAAAFDEIWYGGRPATAHTDAALRAVDQRVRTAPIAVLAGTTSTPAGYRAPL